MVSNGIGRPFGQLLSICLLAIVPPLVAQDKAQFCDDLQKRPMRVGQWASYNWTGGRGDGTTVRMAIVGTEAVDGAPHYWYEMSMNDPKKGEKGKTIIQMLVPSLFSQTGGVRGMIMKTGDQAAMRMSEQMVRMMGGRMGQNLAAEIARGCAEMEVVGWEQVTVPAGTFRALHMKDARQQTEAWVFPDLYFGLLKATMKDGSSMVLTGRGADAKSSITETPQVMPH